MNKFDKFFQSFDKYTEQSEVPLAKGDKVSLFKNDYLVLSCDSKYTLLKDEKNNPIAYKTSKLLEIIKSQELLKSRSIGPAPCPPGKMRVKSRTGKGSYCVNVETGAKVDDDTGQEIPQELSKADKEFSQKMKDIMYNYGHPDDYADLSKDLDNLIDTKIKIKNLEYLQNDLTEESGVNIPESQIHRIAALKKDVMPGGRIFDNFTSKLKQSKQKYETERLQSVVKSKTLALVKKPKEK